MRISKTLSFKILSRILKFASGAERNLDPFDRHHPTCEHVADLSRHVVRFMSGRNQAKAFREVGLPLLLLVGGGFLGLSYFLEGLFEVKVRQP